MIEVEFGYNHRAYFFRLLSNTEVGSLYIIMHRFYDYVSFSFKRKKNIKLAHL